MGWLGIKRKSRINSGIDCKTSDTDQSSSLSEKKNKYLSTKTKRLIANTFVIFAIIAIFTMLIVMNNNKKTSPKNDVNSSTTTPTNKTRNVNEKVGIIYSPEWGELDARPLPEWYDRAKIGIFIHWGVYSVPSYGHEWFWYYWRLRDDPDHGGRPYSAYYAEASKDKNLTDFVLRHYAQGISYQDFAPMLTGEFFKPSEWADLAEKAGARYVILTSKHHDGYTLFPSKYSFNWNSVDVGPHRDIVGELANAVRQRNIEFGVYYSLYEWFNPLYLDDMKSSFETHTYVNVKMRPEFKQLVNDYKPSVIWSDGDQEATSEYWTSAQLLAWLFSKSPVKDNVVVNDRWGKYSFCNHGSFFNCEDRYNPGVLQKHKWESAFNLDRDSWGYRRDMTIMDVLTIEEILKRVVKAVSCGGNVLINIGPTKEGVIPPIFQDRLLELGNWLTINGEAIYDSSPWYYQNDVINEHAWYTCRKLEYNANRPTAVPQATDTIYAIYVTFLRWPTNNTLRLTDIMSVYKFGTWQVRMLGVEQNLKCVLTDDDLHIELPQKHLLSLEYAWTLKFTSNNVTLADN